MQEYSVYPSEVRNVSGIFHMCAKSKCKILVTEIQVASEYYM